MELEIYFEMLEPVTFHVLDEELRKKMVQPPTEGGEFVSDSPITIIPMNPVDPPEPRTPKS